MNGKAGADTVEEGVRRLGWRDILPQLQRQWRRRGGETAGKVPPLWGRRCFPTRLLLAARGLVGA